ncbi:TRAP transporter small permease [Martelella lutilitoris]|uniref:TRAP transporter small permease protein n=1 Tax=Martelella lutilitoris TaxID=2583532 RepID=A0A5C4JT87_9HYPH|nr:TRAP transporter small permease [Martelella lutilitoris]TNB48411.1 TRAP transporter small permease [Martelella lutilitoris]
MSSTTESARHPDGRPPKVLGRTWHILVDGLAALGTVLILVLMLVISADIFMRNLLGSSLPLVSELGALLLVMIVSLQLATTIRADRLARTEIFFPAFRLKRPVAGSLLSAVFNLTGAAMIGLIAWSSFLILQKDWASGEYIGVTGIATLPVWPFRAFIVLGVSVAALEFLVRAVSDLVACRNAGDHP